MAANDPSPGPGRKRARSNNTGTSHTPFWAPRLRSVYERCVLPTLSEHPADHYVVPAGRCTEDNVRKGTWMHQRMVVPPPPLVEDSSTAPSRYFEDRNDGTAPSTAKRRRKAHSGSSGATTENRGGDPEATADRTYRLRLRTTPEQSAELRRWFAAGRWAYNAMVAGVREGRHAGSQADANALVKRNQEHPPPDWVRAVPRCVYKNAAVDAVIAHGNEKTKCAKDPTRRPGVLKFRSARHTPSEVVRLDAAQFPKGRSLFTLAIHCFRAVPEPDRPRPRAHVFFKGGMEPLGPVEVRDRRWLIDRLTTDHYQMREAKLQWDKHRNAFALRVCFAVPIPRSPIADDPDLHGDTERPPRRVVALDPGERRFQTYYDPDTGETGTVLHAYHHPGGGGGGKENTHPATSTTSVRAEIERRCHRIDALQSRVNRTEPWSADGRAGRTGRTVRRWRNRTENGAMPPGELHRRLRRRAHQAHRQARRRLGRELARLRGFKLNMHYAAVNFLCRHWDVVIVSTASMGDMTRRATRRALNWGHYAFRQRLASSVAIRPGKSVIETGEAYTTQTCGRCGMRNPNVGASAVFRCVDAAGCGARIDRDVNGARNIALRVLTERN